MDKQDRKLYRGTLCVLHKDGKYLMKFEEGGINDKCWIFPGGGYKLTSDETRTELGVECAIRETQEETGYTPKNPILRAHIFFNNKFRIFPGKTEVADFDYDALYLYSKDFSGEFNEIGPEGNRLGWFAYEKMRKLNMHEGDHKVLDWLVDMPKGRIIDGVIVHRGSRLEKAECKLI